MGPTGGLIFCSNSFGGAVVLGSQEELVPAVLDFQPFEVGESRFQGELASMGYKYQFITLAGFHALNYGMFSLAEGYRDSGMSAYVELQEQEFAAEDRGYTATKHQREVGAGYFDLVTQVVAGGSSSITALAGSTEEEQFEDAEDAGKQVA